MALAGCLLARSGTFGSDQSGVGGDSILRETTTTSAGGAGGGLGGAAGDDTTTSGPIMNGTGGANTGGASGMNDGGGGTFTAPEPLVHPTLVEGECVTLADLDGDGDIDAFVGNEGESDVVWLNDGAGTFTDVGQELGASDSHAVALADFDGDGDIDVFVANDDDDNGENHNVVWLLSDAPP